MIPVLHGVWAAAGGVSSAFEHIETQTVGAGGAASITFSSIPQTYKHLQIHAVVRDTVVDTGVSNIDARFNSDSGSNYVRHGLQGYSGSTAAPTASSYYVAATTALAIGAGVDANESSAYFAPNIVKILDYANTSKNKTIRTLYGFDNNGTYSLIQFGSGLWMSTAAISSISLVINPSGNFTQHSTFSLYGIK